MSDRASALVLDGIVRRFGPTLALDGASIDVAWGSVHALLGENGAGKTTLMRVAYGMLRPDAGEVVVDGTVRRLATPRDAMRAGIGMVHQHFALVPAMTVAENVALGGHGRFDARAAAERVRAIGRDTGLSLDPEARADTLGVGAQQRLEIVKALARDARILVLDEPTAVLAPAEADELLAWVRGFAGRGGAVVLISHKLREVLRVADAVTVLRRGRTVAAREAAGATESMLATAMLGETGVGPGWGQGGAGVDPGPTLAPPWPHPGPVLSARDLVVRDERGIVRIHGASLDVHAGEILGVVGVEGSGHRELLRALAGRLPVAGGTLARPDAVGFVPEDRHQDAVVLDFTLTENVALAGAAALRGFVRWGARRGETAALLEAHDVRAPGPDAPVRALSGGNQQKLVLARELGARPLALVAENPTRGLDIRAAAAVADRLREARDAGVAVVVHAADLDEVLALADRVVAVYAGTVREVPRDRDAAGRAMLGVAG